MTRPGVNPLPYEAFFDASPDLGFAAGYDGRFKALSASWERTLGMPRKIIAANPIFDRIHPDDKERTLAAVHGMRALSSAGSRSAPPVEDRFENRIRRGDGTYARLSWSAVAVPGEDMFFGSAREITEERSELRRCKRLSDALPYYVSMSELRGEVLYVNPAGRRMIGKTDENTRGSRVQEHLTARAAMKLQEEILPAVARSGVWSGEMELRRVDGSVIPVRRIVVGVRDESGRPEAIATIAQDRSAERRSQSLLRRFEVLGDQMSDLVATATLKGRTTYVNDAGMAMLGRANQDPTSLRLRDVVNNEWRSRFVDEIFPAVMKFGTWSGDVELRHADGSSLPVSQVVLLIRGENGEPVGVGAIVRDQRLQRELGRALREVILAMSTPILQIWKGVLALPVIGYVDSDRAAQMAESLLTNIVKTQSRIAIVDLTGVETTDAPTMRHLLQMASSVSLLGSVCLLSGVSAESAQGITALGLDLSHLRLFATLQAALHFAASITHNRGAARLR